MKLLTASHCATMYNSLSMNGASMEELRVRRTDHVLLDCVSPSTQMPEAVMVLDFSLC